MLYLGLGLIIINKMQALLKYSINLKNYNFLALVVRDLKIWKLQGKH